MITIDQLLESVDLDFEPRWVTKNLDGTVYIWPEEPMWKDDYWLTSSRVGRRYAGLKLAEFTKKDWTECIYEVPRKEKGITELIHQKLTIGKTKYEYPTNEMLRLKINELVEAVNELKGAKNETKI